MHGPVAAAPAPRWHKAAGQCGEVVVGLVPLVRPFIHLFIRSFVVGFSFVGGSTSHGPIAAAPPGSLSAQDRWPMLGVCRQTAGWFQLVVGGPS